MKKKKKKHCRICSRKVDVFSEACNCGNYFCARHVYPEHSCAETIQKKKTQNQTKVQLQNPKFHATHNYVPI